MDKGKRACLASICVALVSLAWAGTAQAAFDDQLFFFTPQLTDSSAAPPFGYLDGPCGLAVNAGGQIYLSDYYHRAVDVFSPSPAYGSQPLIAYSGLTNPHTGPVDDPCGLALDGSGTLYVNNYHRNVVRFPAPVSLGNAGNRVIDSGDPADIYANPTGVAVNSSTNHAYVDDRSYLAEYDSSGTMVQRIGAGKVGDGYGIAVSGYPGTAGYLYVPDASTKTIKVFNPAVDAVNPIGSFAKPGGFGSLRDSSVAVDNATGEIYVVDTIGPQLTESPQATVYVFTAAGSYEGRLKHNTINAAPTGLAVDNTSTSSQGRVYVTSGIAENASIYGYPRGAATSSSAPPLTFRSFPANGGSGSAAPSSSASATAAPSSASLAGTLAPAATTSPSSSVPASAPKHSRARHRQRKRGHHHRRHRHGAKRGHR